MQNGAPIWKGNICFFTNIIFCDSKNIKSSADFECATFPFFFMKEHLRMCMCTCLLEDLAQYRLSLEKKPLLTPKIMKTRNED